MRLLQSLGYKVTFVPDHPVAAGPMIGDLQRMGVEVIHAPDTKGLLALLKARGAEFDLVCLDGAEATRRTLRMVRRLAPRARTILMIRDVDASSPSTRQPWGIARLTRIWPAGPLQTADAIMTEVKVLVDTQQDMARRQRPVALAPHVFDIPVSIPPPEARNGVVFQGISDHPADREAVELLWREVMPAVRDRRPGTLLHVYGLGWSGILAGLPTTAGVSVEGDVADICAAYGRHRVGVVPMASGPHFVGRIADALACGLPLILSPEGARMAGLGIGPEADVAEQPEEWAERIIMLIDDDGIWQSRSDASLRFAREAYSFEHGRSLMRAALIAAGEPEPLATEALVVSSARPSWSIL
jgi:hypothetical protein